VKIISIYCDFIVQPEPSEGRRQSSRTRVRPVEWWLGEKVIYE